MSRFGELLLIARERAELSQLALAKKVDVDNSYISRMERGVFTPPSREVAVRLADVLGIRDKKERFAFLLAAGVANEADVQGLKLVEEGTQISASPDAVFHSPLTPSDLKILLHRLAALENKLLVVEKCLHDTYEAADKNLRETHKELRDITALIVDMQREE
jgi:transcriptional regulator with XRE-family HTH domain